MRGIFIRALGTNQKLELIYINKDNQITHRIIKVLAVTETSIKAYCYHKRQFRIFKIANILSVTPLRRSRGA
ncbi:hypothetical protein [Lederbergia graminis]|uniref:WYL domain-containing protein n=1 Tax=Lederbergia graminis TaxID=735518 RepID=A0ABW0LP43_9BACI